jgi:replication fork clamp-binding protein CrfC
MSAVPFHSKQVPPDSYIVLSVKAKKLISETFIKESTTWTPILNDWSNSKPELLEFFIDPNSSGLNLGHPIHFFSTLKGLQKPDIIIGMFASVGNTERADSSLSAIAENFNIQKNQVHLLVSVVINYLMNLVAKTNSFILSLLSAGQINQGNCQTMSSWTRSLIHSLERIQAQKCLLP